MNGKQISGLKDQHHLAQGIALGIMVRFWSVLKGLKPTSSDDAFALSGRSFHMSQVPRRCLGLCADALLGRFAQRVDAFLRRLATCET